MVERRHHNLQRLREMTDTPFTDKHASPWVPEPNTDWVPAYMVRELEREFNAAKSEVERIREEIQKLKEAN
jgi:hypothetical protein